MRRYRDEKRRVANEDVFGSGEYVVLIPLGNKNQPWARCYRAEAKEIWGFEVCYIGTRKLASKSSP